MKTILSIKFKEKIASWDGKMGQFMIAMKQLDTHISLKRSLGTAELLQRGAVEFHKEFLKQLASRQHGVKGRHLPQTPPHSVSIGGGMRARVDVEYDVGSGGWRYCLSYAEGNHESARIMYQGLVRDEEIINYAQNL